MLFARSACEGCGIPLAPLELLPLASFLLQRGQCRSCRARIAPFHLAIELAALAVPAMAALAHPDASTLWMGCALGWTLLALAWIDWETLLLPDALTLPLLLAGLTLTAIRAPDALAAHALAAIAGYAVLRALALAYRALRGRDGLGAGDAKLLAAAGAWLGPQPLPHLLLLAALAALLAAGLAALAGRRIARDTALPFGPWLALAFWLLWWFGTLPDGAA